MGVEPRSEFAKKRYVTARLFFVLRVFVVDVETIEAVIFKQPNGGRDKLGPQSGVDDDWVELRGVGPASDGEDDLEMTVLLLELVDRFEVSVKVLAAIVPGITGVMNVGISPWVGKDDFTTVGLDVGERIENVAAVQIMRSRRRQRDIRTHVRLLTGMRDGGNFLP